jgi:hypothetical protein
MCAAGFAHRVNGWRVSAVMPSDREPSAASKPRSVSGGSRIAEPDADLAMTKKESPPWRIGRGGLRFYPAAAGVYLHADRVMVSISAADSGGSQ